MSTSLDHIILLLSHKEFRDVPAWLSNNFNVIEGGTHSKGTSHNKLIIFKDGTYLELFSWVHPQPQGTSPHADFPSWASKPEGYIIDWALTGDDAHANHDGIMKRLEQYREKRTQNPNSIDMTYDRPTGGGRRRKDGKELQWMTTRPRLSTTSVDNTKSRLDVPFFCHDITDRRLRVPYEDASITNHPCGAVGVRALTIKVSDSELEQYSKLYSAILGHNAEISTTEFLVDLPVSESMQDSQGKCMVTLQSEKSSEPFFEGSGIAIQKLCLLTEKTELKGRVLDSTGLGASVELC